MIKRIGIIGAGKVVEDMHLPVIKNLKELKVAWVCDTDLNRSKLLSRMYQVPHLPVQKAISVLDDVDLCLIATPVGVRKNYIEACAQAGIAVYSEKPFARTRAEHEYYCSLFPDYKIAAGFQRRFYKNIHTLREIIKSGVFGNLKRIELNHGQYSLKSGGAHRYITNPKLSGGGVVIDSGIHCLDQILFSTAATGVEVEVARAIVFNGIDYETTIFSTITMESKHRVEVECNHTSLRNFHQRFKYFFDTAEVRLGMNPDSQVRAQPLNEGKREKVNFEVFNGKGDTPWASTPNQSYYLSWIFFLKGLLEGRPQMTSAAENYLTTGWVEDIYSKVLS